MRTRAVGREVAATTGVTTAEPPRMRARRRVLVSRWLRGVRLRAGSRLPAHGLLTGTEPFGIMTD